MQNNTIQSFDFDGVVSIGICPGPNDIIITGRCIDEQEHVLSILKNRNINNAVYFNPMLLSERGNHSIEARTFSGKHKARTLNLLKQRGIKIQYHFEDDEIQQQIIEQEGPKEVTVIKIESPIEK